MPPASGPMIDAIPPQAVQAPIAPPRSRSENAPTMTAKEAGVSKPAAAPWSARAAINSPMVGANALARENTPNDATPSAKMRRSP